ncbi:MAG: hypothetical protein ACXWWL_07640 [Candidatus Limnocylindria bacterium]
MTGAVEAAVDERLRPGLAAGAFILSSYQSNDVDPAPPSSGDVPVSFNGDKVTVNGRVYDATKITC